MKKKYKKKKNKNFEKIIFALFLAGFSNFFMLYFSQPILSFFSKKFYLSPIESSLSLSVSTACMAIGTLFSSFLADFFGRKKVIFLSLLLSILFTFFSIFANSWNQIILFRALVGFFLSGVTPISIIYLSEEIDASSLSKSIGLYISGNTIGGFSGRLFSSIGIHYFSWKILFLLIGLFSFFLIIIFYYYLPESKNFKSSNITLKSLKDNFLFQITNEKIVLLFIIGFFTMGSFVAVFNYINYRLSIMPFHLSSKSISFISSIYLVGIYFSQKSSNLVKKNGIFKILIISLILMIIGLFLTFWNYLLIIFFGLLLFSSGFFLCHSVISNLVSYFSLKFKIFISPLYFFFYYMGASILGTLNGYIWFKFDWFGVIEFLTICLLISIIAILRLKKLIK
ncbi:MFS transporter [Buchnera aphidicola]|uniref:MFS transporter n=1 Tax=Buchnera aphidicola TaxID=9 RepID=UPI0030ED7957